MVLPAWAGVSARRRAPLPAVVRAVSGEEVRQVPVDCLRCARGPNPARGMVMVPTSPRRPMVVLQALLVLRGRAVHLGPGPPGPEGQALREPAASWAVEPVRVLAVVKMIRKRGVASTRRSALRVRMNCRRAT